VRAQLRGIEGSPYPAGTDPCDGLTRLSCLASTTWVWKSKEGVRLPPSSLISDRIIPALLDRFPGLSTFAAWGLRRIQRDCLFKDVAGHPWRSVIQTWFLRLPCGQLDVRASPCLPDSRPVALRASESPCSPKCTALSRFREPLATAWRLSFYTNAP